MEQVLLRDLGRIPYREAWTLQEEFFDRTVEAKIARRDARLPHTGGLHHLLFCEHDPVFTIGRNGREAHLLVTEPLLAAQGAELVRINRGGDITFHGPGQVVGYPILDLDCLFTDVGRYLRALEETVIRAIAGWGLAGERLPGATGVWLDAEDPVRARKICAIGIRTGRWVTMHGFALNVNTDLSWFGRIVPCGIADKKVTSIAAETGREVPLNKVKRALAGAFAEVFGVRLRRGEGGPRRADGARTEAAGR